MRHESADDPAGAAWSDPADGYLDLRWTPDEIDYLTPDPRDVWRHLVGEDLDKTAEVARAYALHDPHGSGRAAPILSGYFDTAINPSGVVCGAGVSSLLRDLLVLAGDGPVLVGEHSFADLPGWVRMHGNALFCFDEQASYGAWRRELAHHRPALMIVERPTFGGRVCPRHALGLLLRDAAQLGTVVLVDESYSNYLNTSSSAIHLLRRFSNLAVVRGVSKGYCQGGLRVGFVLSSPFLAQRVREAVPAMQTSELALRFGLGMLALPDPIRSLRERIAEMKPAAIGLLRARGIPVLSGHPALPWALSAAADATRARLDRVGVLVKHLPAMNDSSTPYVRIAIPLSDARARRLHLALDGS